MEIIRVQGARTHNLKNITLSLPRAKLIVITGPSGSGKSSLAFDTLYAEGQRRYVESLSAYARQFLSLMEKPNVDVIEGLSPAIAIEQKVNSHNPRSTVGTTTEIYDYLRLLFARVGIPRCPHHHCALTPQTISQMVDQIVALPSDRAYMLLAPIIQQRKGEHTQLLANLVRQGYLRVRIDGQVYELSGCPPLSPQKKHTIEVVVDRFKVGAVPTQRLAESLETALSFSNGVVCIVSMDDPLQQPLLFSVTLHCPYCGYSFDELEPRLFSFNNPMGACKQCDGLGVERFFDAVRVVENPHLSLAEGAIRGWGREHAAHFQRLTALAAHYGFDLETPFLHLSSHIQKILLHGSQESIQFKWCDPHGHILHRTQPFKGILHYLEQRYQDSHSFSLREALARYITTRPCEACQGTRLREEARCVYIADRVLPELTAMDINQLHHFLTHLCLEGQRAVIAEKILTTVCQRLQFLLDVGLHYLTLSRSAETLSGGEAQRIRLATQIGSGLVGVLYVLDEPSIGLHQRDNGRLLHSLKRLRDLGNTIIMVEHDEEAIRAADYIVDIGPGAGIHGGEVVAQGAIAQIIATPASLTGQFLSGKRQIQRMQPRVPFDKQRVITLQGAGGNNLKEVTLTLPVGLLTCITGVSGSGKSTLINDTLLPIAYHQLHQSRKEEPKPYRSIEGLSYFDLVVNIDQAPIGRTPRSNPATYTGLFTSIRELFSQLSESRQRGYAPGRFSFNIRGGRCEACTGDGVIKVEMHFLPDLYVPCDQCQGRRYNRETLEVKYKNHTIHQILEMTIEEASLFFAAIPAIARKLQALQEVGLAYLQLGQAATTLSGGEAQRIKLARELSKRSTGRTLYVLDEPTTGLHFADVEQLLLLLHRLRDQGNTVVVIEHNLDVIKTADWIVDLGPEGGEGGGEIIVAGTPEVVACHPHSQTGVFLKPLLA